MNTVSPAVPGLARLAEQCEAGRPAGLRRQRGIAQTAATAGRRDHAGTRTDQVGQHLAVLGQHDGAVRDAELQIGTVGTVLVGPLALLAMGGRRVRAEVEVQQGVHTRVHDEDDVAAATAVAAVRSAQRLELLPVHGGTAVPAVTGGNVDHHPVDESGHHNFLLQ